MQQGLRLEGRRYEVGCCVGLAEHRAVQPGPNPGVLARSLPGPAAEILLMLLPPLCCRCIGTTPHWCTAAAWRTASRRRALGLRCVASTAAGCPAAGPPTWQPPGSSPTPRPAWCPAWQTLRGSSWRHQGRLHDADPARLRPVHSRALFAPRLALWLPCETQEPRSTPSRRTLAHPRCVVPVLHCCSCTCTSLSQHCTPTLPARCAAPLPPLACAAAFITRRQCAYMFV